MRLKTVLADDMYELENNGKERVIHTSPLLLIIKEV